MSENRFTWIKFFQEVHKKIHNDYNSVDLANIANKIFGHIKDIDIDGKEISIEEMTPINFIGYFNRKLTYNNKLQACKMLKDLMELNSDVPIDFDGIPEFNNQNCLCMTFKKDRANYIIDEQWKISKQILNNNVDAQLFDKILSKSHRYIGISYLSRFCFIVNPDIYYPCDDKMSSNLGLDLPKTYKDYIKYCNLLKSKYPGKTSYELSYEAFKGSMSQKELNKKEVINMQKSMLPDTNIFSKNQILYGPPGTGKTYNTVIKAIEITNPELIQRDKDGNVENYELLKEKFDELKQQGQIEFVTFHQSYSYEEFVEGIKPDISKWNDDGSVIKYVGKDGIFKNIAKKALFSHLNILASDDEKFKNIIKCFIDDNSEGSKFKTQYSEFEIVRYTQTAIIVEPCNGKTEYNLTFNNLEKLYRNKQDVRTRKDIEQILGWRGLSTYYLAILNKLKDYSEKNITNIQTNSNEDSIIIKSIDDYLQEYYEGNLTLKEEPKKYILIIDEINRGDVSKIFGELITLIEEDKRIGKEHQMTVTLPYSREPFGVPNNLYIIGTMNTADRSIALLDTALRRRFDFEEMMPKPELLRGKDIEGVDLEQLLTKINDRIKNEYDRDHQIGHSYLMEVENKEQLERAYKNRILPLLNEYFYNDIDSVAKILNCKPNEITSKENWFNVLKEAQKPTKKDNEQ